MQLSLPGVPILMCFFLRCTKPATSTAVAQAPRVFSCWRNAFGCVRCLKMARPFDEQCCCPSPVMRPSVNESVQSASQASLQKQCFCLCAGNADFLANDIRCKKGLDGLGCLGEPAAWPTCAHAGAEQLGSHPSRELRCPSLAGGLPLHCCCQPETGACVLLAARQHCSSMCHFLECSICLPAGDMGWYCIRASLWAYEFDKPLSVSAHAGGCPKGYASTWLLCHRLVCPVAAWQPALHCLVRLPLAARISCLASLAAPQSVVHLQQPHSSLCRQCPCRPKVSHLLAQECRAACPWRSVTRLSWTLLCLSNLCLQTFQAARGTQ